MSALPGLFITGTDTEVGKTTITAAIARRLSAEGRKVGVFKPAATGCARVGDTLVSDDATKLAAAIEMKVSASRVVPYMFEAPLAPPVAAALEGVALPFAAIREAWAEAARWWIGRAEVLLIEGVGGLLCPLADDATVADFALVADYPLVIVARGSLGTLNHTLLTCEAARRRGLRIAGVILNQPTPDEPPLTMMRNRNMLARLLDGIPLLATVQYHNQEDDAVDLMGNVLWSDRALIPRHGEG